MSEDVERLNSALNVASQNLRKIVGGKAGEGTENKYGEAYQALVRAGARPQLRAKYRR